MRGYGIVARWWLIAVLSTCGYTFTDQARSQEAKQPFASNSNPVVPEEKKNWVVAYLQEDPLAAKEALTFDDIRNALADPNQRERVLPQHFYRVAEPDLETKRKFLMELFTHESPIVRGQAAEELQKLGLLRQVVMERLQALLDSDQEATREAAMVGLSNLEETSKPLSDEEWKAMLDALASDSALVREAAEKRFQLIGPSIVPRLLEHLQDERPEVSQRVAIILSRIVNEELYGEILESRVAPSRVDPTMMAPAEAIRNIPEQHRVRQEEQGKPKLIRVYYGTNRERMQEERGSWNTLKWLVPAFSISLLVTGAYTWRSLLAKGSQQGCLAWLISTVGIVAVLFLGYLLVDEVRQVRSLAVGIKYGPRRDHDASTHYGFCDVSIPPTHTIGELESPLLGQEDEAQHVVLQRVEEQEANQFFELVKVELSKRSTDEKSCFIFIHGFNVRFDDAARRTAQIHHDLKFSGVPLFFSWPSRGSVHHYFSDRNEIAFSQYVIKDFLTDVLERVKADKIHVIAHSMGADATCRAIAEMGERGKCFDQIVLAAPDIDRDLFRIQLLPRIHKTADRITLYCSKNDMALHLSKSFNDAPRVGDSSQRLMVAREVDTIDASGIDTALLGHSYYGDCMPIINDLSQLILKRLAPDDRMLKAWPFEEELKYWTFLDEFEAFPVPEPEL